MSQMEPIFKTLSTRIHERHVYLIEFNRPEKFNALSPQLYDEWLAALIYARDVPTIRVVVVTGRGSYFSAGQELGLPELRESESVHDYFVRRVGVSKTLIDTLITYPKMLIHAVNGPALGFGVTTTALADLIYSVPHATFRTPFMELSLCVEGCSTVTIPKALGPSKAKEMLFLGKTMTAQEWEQAGLIAEIFPKEGFLDHVLQKAVQIASFAPDAVKSSLALVKQVDRDLLLKMNALEMKLLIERLVSEEFQAVVVDFMSKKKSSGSKKDKKTPSEGKSRL